MPPRIGSHRMIASGFLAALHLVLATAYAFPEVVRGYPPPPDVVRVSIVSYIDSLGPTWQFGFGVTGVVIALGLYWHRLLALAHTLGGASMAIYAAALWFGFAFSSPHPSIVSALAYTALTVWHLTIGVTYARLTESPHRVMVSAGRVEPERTSHRKGGR